jgi:CheY-specific phosphatase CheX
LTKKDLIFLRQLQEKALLSEFKLQGLFYQMLKNNLQKSYINYVFDFKEDKLKISKELFQIIEKGYTRLSEMKMDLIKRISKKISEKLSKDIVKDLKGIDKLNQFEKMIMSWIEEIPNLMTTDEFNSLCNIREF